MNQYKKLLYNIIIMKIFIDKYILPSFCHSGEYGVNKSYNTISDDSFKSIQNLNYKKTLDIGCGGGRLANGFLLNNANLDYYVGIDVKKNCIDFCTKNFTNADKRFNFYHIMMYNARYNKVENKKPNDNMFESIDPFNQTYTLIHLYSVFTHLCPTDVIFYLSKIRSCLEKKGHVYLTVFVEEDFDKDYEENPPHKNLTAGSLHCCLYNKAYFESLVLDHGFKIITNSFEVNSEYHPTSHNGIILYILTID